MAPVHRSGGSQNPDRWLKELRNNQLASGNRAESPVNVKETELLEAFRKLSQEKQDAVLQNVKWLEE